MNIDRNVIKHIADLSKIQTSEKKIGTVLEYMDVLQKVDTKNIFATNQVTGFKNIFREDIVKAYPQEKREKLIREVPKMKNGYVVVPHSISKLN